VTISLTLIQPITLLVTQAAAFYTMDIGGYIPSVQLLGREVDNSLPSTIEVKNAWSYNPQQVFMKSCLIRRKIRFHAVVNWLSVN